MKTATPLIWISFILTVMFGLSACTDSNKETENTSAIQEVQKVKVKEVRLETVDNKLEYTGTIEAFEVIHLGAATPGQVEEVYVEIGDRVEKGQLIALFDQTKLQQAIIHLKRSSWILTGWILCWERVPYLNNSTTSFMHSIKLLRAMSLFLKQIQK